MLTFSPLGEKVNTIMVLIHQQVKKSTLGKIVKNCRIVFDNVRKGEKLACVKNLVKQIGEFKDVNISSFS